MTLRIIYDILIMIGGQMKLSTLRYFVEISTENSFTKFIYISTNFKQKDIRIRVRVGGNTL